MDVLHEAARGRLFAEGAFNAAFVPLFGERLEKDGITAARTFAAEAAAVMVAALLTFTLLAIITMPILMYLIAPGFAGHSEKFELTIELTRITFPYLTFMALIALMGGMLNTMQKFAATAAAPIRGESIRGLKVAIGFLRHCA